MHKIKVSYKSSYLFFLVIYILCLPLNAMNIGPFGSALKILAIIPVGIALLSGTKFKVSVPLKAQFIFTVFALFSMAWSVTLDDSIGRVVSYVLLFVLLLSGTFFTYNQEDIQRVKSALAWSSRLSALVMLIFAEYVNGRFRLMGIIKEDPNYLCAYFAFGVIFSLGVLTGKAKALRKVLAVAELILYFYLILISGSRGGLIAIVSGAVAYLITYGDKKNKHIIRKLILLTIAGFVIISMIDYLPEYLRLRFTIDNVVEDGGSGRTQLWKQAIDLFSNANVFRQLFGFGTASVRWCFAHYGYYEVNVVHNMFLETLTELGVIGLCLYSTAIFSFIKVAFKLKDKFAFAVIFSMLVMSLSTSIYTFKPYFNIMLFILVLQNVIQTGAGENVEI